MGIGKRIREVRGEASQAEFAREFAVAPSRISDWEREFVEPPLDFLQGLSTKKSVDLNWLLTGQTAVREAGATYRVNPTAEAQRLAQQLLDHPLLLAAVKKALAADDQLSRAATEMAKALGISAEDAYLKLLEMKGAK